MACDITINLTPTNLIISMWAERVHNVKTNFLYKAGPVHLQIRIIQICGLMKNPTYISSD